MNADERRSLDELTERVLGAVFEVANTLGAGFLEDVVYKDRSVGEYFADILVEDALVVELKCVDRLTTVSWLISKNLPWNGNVSS